jgi:hypothetical protein
MKKLILFSCFLLMTSMTIAQSNNKPAVLRHVVMFGWKSGTDQAHIDKVVKAFGKLQSKIPLIKDFEWGVNNSPEKLNQGLTHCFFVTFNSEADRDAYLIHPDHQAFVALLNPAPDKITVLDYWVH